MITTHTVPVADGDLHVTEQPGDGTAVVLLHGFPDDSRSYTGLLPHLAPRRAVAFDFLGYGHSSRPSRPDPGQHEAEVTAVLDALGIERAVLAGHDAGGPVAVNVALASPQRVSGLVLMNTYYGTGPGFRLPEMIRLFADPELTPLADAVTADPQQRMWLLGHTARQFGYDPDKPGFVAVNSIVPQFFGEPGVPDALPAIRAWTGALFPALADQDAAIAGGRLASLDVPVTLAFGAGDQYLNPGLARHLAGLFGSAQLHLIDGASHWPQGDQPEALGRLLARSMPSP